MNIESRPIEAEDQNDLAFNDYSLTKIKVGEVENGRRMLESLGLSSKQEYITQTCESKAIVLWTDVFNLSTCFNLYVQQLSVNIKFSNERIS